MPLSQQAAPAPPHSAFPVHRPPQISCPSEHPSSHSMPATSPPASLDFNPLLVSQNTRQVGQKVSNLSASFRRKRFSVADYSESAVPGSRRDSSRELTWLRLPVSFRRPECAIAESRETNSPTAAITAWPSTKVLSPRPGCIRPRRTLGPCPDNGSTNCRRACRIPAWLTFVLTQSLWERYGFRDNPPDTRTLSLSPGSLLTVADAFVGRAMTSPESNLVTNVVQRPQVTGLLVDRLPPKRQCVESEEDERALGQYIDAIRQAQAMDRCVCPSPPV